MVDEKINPVVGLDEIIRLLEGYVRPYVEIGLLRETIEYEQKKPSKQEAKKIKRSIDRAIDKELSDDECPSMDKKTKDELKKGIYGIVDGKIDLADEEEIVFHSHEAGDVMATIWVEYLSLALENQKEIPLNKYLLPKDITTINPELQKAYDESFFPLVIKKEDIPYIMGRLTQTLFEDRNYIDLVLEISIEKVSDGYVARQCSYQQPQD
ncbi:MAG: hypothetical protein U9R08_04820 [Nanoarchaeota archaeon]|nr:hypothetical protein [Nanoarchaeota archaeon]